MSEHFENRSYWLLAWLSLFPVGVYATLSLIRASKLNWTGPCWLALIPFLALLLTQKPAFSKPRLLNWSQRAWPTTAVILLLIYGAGFHYLGIGFPNTPFPKNTHLLGFQGLGREVENIKNQIQNETGRKILVVGMDRNKIASGLAFYRAKYISHSPSNNPAFDTASEHLFGDVGLMYELWFPVTAQQGKSLLLVGESAHDLNSQAVISRVENAGEIRLIEAYKDGKLVGRYHYRLVEGYHQP
jgi:dolichol-phosphate mannosyltransferase